MLLRLLPYVLCWQALAEASKQKRAKAEKERKEQEEKAAAEKKRVTEAADEAAAKLIAHAKTSRIFALSWEQAGHPAVRCFPNLQAWTDYLATDEASFAKPAVIKQCAPKQCTKLDARMKAWVPAFEKHCRDKNKDFVYAPMDQGKEDLATLAEQVVPPKNRSKGLPSVQKMCADPTLYGFTSASIFCEYEIGYLGSMWFHYSGKMAVLLLSAVDLERAKLAQEPKATKVTTKGLRNYAMGLDAKDLTEEKQKALKDSGLVVHNITLNAKDCLIIPPGFLLLGAPVDNTACFGTRQSFIFKDTGCAELMSGVAKILSGEDADKARILGATVDSINLEV